jgi:hypothetical protein
MKACRIASPLNQPVSDRAVERILGIENEMTGRQNLVKLVITKVLLKILRYGKQGVHQTCEMAIFLHRGYNTDDTRIISR